jgi:hypothetical protein
VKGEGENPVLTLLIENEIIQEYLLIIYRKRVRRALSPSLFTIQTEKKATNKARKS